jgi:hypothetical protein
MMVVFFSFFSREMEKLGSGGKKEVGAYVAWGTEFWWFSL